MALHTLGSQDYLNLEFSEKLWSGVDTSKIGNLVYDFFPEISRVTSKSENKAFKWFFGRVLVEGLGNVSVVYPYLETSDELLIIRNVSFSQFPYILLKAHGHETSRFECWKDSVTGQVLSKENTILLTEDTFPTTTGIIAEFLEYEDDLGF